MKKIITLVFASMLLFLAGCQAATPEPVPTNTEPPPTSTVEPTVVEPTVEVVVEVDYCVDCHTDKDQLIAVAEPEEDTESESSGVG